MFCAVNLCSIQFICVCVYSSWSSDDQTKHIAPPPTVPTPPPSKTPEQAPATLSDADSKQEVLEVRPSSPIDKVPIPSREDSDVIAAAPHAPPPVMTSLTNNPKHPEPQVADSVDAPVVPEAPAQEESEESSAEMEQTSDGVVEEEHEIAKEKESELVADIEPASVSSSATIISTSVEAPAVANGSDEAFNDAMPATTVTPVVESALESKEQPLLNGLPQDPEVDPDAEPECSTDPVAEPVVLQVQQSFLTAAKALVEEEVEQKAEEISTPAASCPVEETTMQGI